MTKTASPYRTLGIKKNATADQIRAAHRKMVMEYHPDRGGDPAQFIAIQKAYELLIDPIRRAKFDLVGDTSDPRRVEEQAMLMKVISVQMAEVVRDLADQLVNPEATDVLEVLEKYTKKRLADLKKVIGEMKKAVDFLARSMPRFKFKDGDTEGENLLESAARSHLSQAEQQLAIFEVDAGHTAAAIEYLKQYKYEFTRALRGSRDVVYASSAGDFMKFVSGQQWG